MLGQEALNSCCDFVHARSGVGDGLSDEPFHLIPDALLGGGDLVCQFPPETPRNCRRDVGAHREPRPGDIAGNLYLDLHVAQCR